ncbi:uncharacterized protein LY79DRAFT_140957 [Colletotrichum navitas]|uniref:Uncharacterized protein n=1 Tax=Colletotrichum navitas TaxID=681940 RepID=A0AAD8QE60_9PEZI|nr:uncharacterized protein LY79DRAFT_140957 [Colletotrichum navitas]KAK1599444.1 hypothetical protein LY79DRAFT_140957 [Colletotrichum navitas]
MVVFGGCLSWGQVRLSSRQIVSPWQGGVSEKHTEQSNYWWWWWCFSPENSSGIASVDCGRLAAS